MEARIEFQDGDLRAQLRAAQQGASDMTPLMDMIGDQLVTTTKRRFNESNEAPDGTPWPKSFRVIVGQGGKTLNDTQALRDSVVTRATATEVEIGSNLIKAAVHQFGATITAKNGKGLAFRLADGSAVLVGSVKIPARPYLGVSREDEEIISQDLVPAYWAGVLADA